MKTYPHIRADGTISSFEISNAFPWSWGFMRRVLAAVPYVTNFKRVRSYDDRFVFMFLGRNCVVNEPFGDNSRYWIGPVGNEPRIDMTPVQEAFSRFRVCMTFDTDFWRR